MRRYASYLLVVLLGMTFLAACGSDEEATALDVTVTETGDQVDVDIPSTVDAGVVNLSLTNSGQGPHSLQFLKVTGAHTTDELIAFLDSEEEGGPIPDWISEGGGIGVVPPGQTGRATFALTEGKHFVWDDESDENDVSNITKGAIKEIEVTGSGGGELPDGDTTVTANEYKFDTGELKAGTNKVRFENDGQELHHMIALPMAQGATIDDVKAAFEAEGEPAGPPPVDFEKAVNTAVIGPDNAVVADLQLESGNYALVCFINNRTGGPPHLAMGMLNQVTVA